MHDNIGSSIYGVNSQACAPTCANASLMASANSLKSEFSKLLSDVNCKELCNKT